MKLTTNNKLHTAIIDGMKSGAITSVIGWDSNRDLEFNANAHWDKWIFETTNPNEKSQWGITPSKAFFNVLSCSQDACMDIWFEDDTWENIEDEQIIIDKINSWDVESFEFK